MRGPGGAEQTLVQFPRESHPVVRNKEKINLPPARTNEERVLKRFYCSRTNTGSGTVWASVRLVARRCEYCYILTNRTLARWICARNAPSCTGSTANPGVSGCRWFPAEGLRRSAGGIEGGGRCAIPTNGKQLVQAQKGIARHNAAPRSIS